MRIILSIILLVSFISCGKQTHEKIETDYEKCQNQLFHRWEDNRCQTFEELGAPEVLTSVPNQTKHVLQKTLLSVKRKLFRRNMILDIKYIVLIPENKQEYINEKTLYMHEEHKDYKLVEMFYNAGMYDQFDIFWVKTTKSSQADLIKIKRYFDKAIQKLKVTPNKLIHVLLDENSEDIITLKKESGLYKITLDDRVSYEDVLETLSKIKDEIVTKSTGVVGATCWSDPQVFATVNGRKKKIFCFGFQDQFYAGVTQFVAKASAVRKCKSANALDPSGNYPDASSTCYKRCEVDTHCTYMDNR